MIQQQCHAIKRIIKNDMFVLAWTIINTIFGINSLDCFTNNNSINCSLNGNSVSGEVHLIFLVITVVGALLLSYIILVVEIFASISSYLCADQLRLMIVKFNIGDSNNSDNIIRRKNAGISSYSHANCNNTTRKQFTYRSQSSLLAVVQMMVIYKLFSITIIISTSTKQQTIILKCNNTKM